MFSENILHALCRAERNKAFCFFMFRTFWLDLITLILLLLKVIHLRGNSILWKQYFIKTWYLYFYFCSRSAVKENIWNLEIVQRTEIWGYNKQHCLPGLNFPHIECSDCFQTSSLLCGMGEIPSVHGLLTHWSFSTINAFVNLPALLPAWLDPHEPRSLAFPIMCCKTPPSELSDSAGAGSQPKNHFTTHEVYVDLPTLSLTHPSH